MAQIRIQPNSLSCWMPAFAGMTGSHHFMQQRRSSRGMTATRWDDVRKSILMSLPCNSQKNFAFNNLLSIQYYSDYQYEILILINSILMGVTMSGLERKEANTYKRYEVFTVVGKKTVMGWRDGQLNKEHTLQDIFKRFSEAVRKNSQEEYMVEVFRGGYPLKTDYLRGGGNVKAVFEVHAYLTPQESDAVAKKGEFPMSAIYDIRIHSVLSAYCPATVKRVIEPPSSVPDILNSESCRDYESYKAAFKKVLEKYNKENLLSLLHIHEPKKYKVWADELIEQLNSENSQPATLFDHILNQTSQVWERATGVDKKVKEKREKQEDPNQEYLRTLSYALTVLYPIVNQLQQQQSMGPIAPPTVTETKLSSPAASPASPAAAAATSPVAAASATPAVPRRIIGPMLPSAAEAKTPSPATSPTASPIAAASPSVTASTTAPSTASAMAPATPTRSAASPPLAPKGASLFSSRAGSSNPPPPRGSTTSAAPATEIELRTFVAGSTGAPNSNTDNDDSNSPNGPGVVVV